MLAKKIRNEPPSWTTDQKPYWRSDMRQEQLDCFYESLKAGMLVLRGGVCEAEMLAIFDYQGIPVWTRRVSTRHQLRPSQHGTGVQQRREAALQSVFHLRSHRQRNTTVSRYTMLSRDFVPW